MIIICLLSSPLRYTGIAASYRLFARRSNIPSTIHQEISKDTELSNFSFSLLELAASSTQVSCFEFLESWSSRTLSAFGLQRSPKFGLLYRASSLRTTMATAMAWASSIPGPWTLRLLDVQTAPPSVSSMAGEMNVVKVNLSCVYIVYPIFLVYALRWDMEGQ